MRYPAARPSWPAAVSPLVLDTIAGPRRGGVVLGVFPTSVYIGLEGHADVVALLAGDALLLPIGMRLAAPSREVCWGVGAGDVVEVGEGRVRLPRADVVAARVQRPARVRAAQVQAAQVRAAQVRAAQVRAAGAAGPLEGAGEELAGLARGLATAALAGAPVRGPLLRLVGAGPGLTPSGDDAVSGALLRLRAAGQLAAVDHIDRALVPLLGRTTSISAALLRAAGRGYAVPEVVTLVDLVELAHRSAQPIGPALDRVLAIGHSSGRDLVAGIVGADHALAIQADPGDPSSTTTRVQEGILHG